MTEISQKGEGHFLDHPEVDALWHSVLDSLLAESDRGAVLVGTSYVDLNLKKLFEVTAPSELRKKRLASILEYPGPLSTLAARTQVAFLFRLINRNLYDAIEALREIRNNVAHGPDQFVLGNHRDKLERIYNIGPGMPLWINRMACELLGRSFLDKVSDIRLPDSDKPFFDTPADVLKYIVVDGISALDRYPWTGHAVLMGFRCEAWQDTTTVLGQFGCRPRPARLAYGAFVVEGVGRGRRPEFAGGGLRRSQAGWDLREAMRRGRERWSFDERVLGSSAFVERVIAHCVQEGRVIPSARREAAWQVGEFIRDTAERTGLSAVELATGSRRREVVVARAIVCTTAVKEHGLPVAVVARSLGISPRSVLRAMQRRQARVT